MRLLLVYPEIQSSITNTATYSLPLGLGAVATYCRRVFGDELEAKILDGSMMDHQEQAKELAEYQPDIAGFAPTIASQGNAYALAREAKEAGALVVFGGVNATNLWEQMLRNRAFIDAVVLFEGEGAMAELLARLRAGKKGDELFESIPNLAYRGAKGELVGPGTIQVFPLNDFPDIDYSLFDLSRYFMQTKQRGFGRAVTYYAGKGCAKRSRAELKPDYSASDYATLVSSMKTCSFCGRNELGFRCLTPDRERALLQQLHDTHGVTGFFNVQDTVNLDSVDPIGLEECWFRLFIGVESITSRNVERLRRRYGPNLILQAGVEAAAPEMRLAMGKTSFTEAELFAKVEMLEQLGIQLHASFIFGGRGETQATMRSSARVARRLADYPNVTWILISPQLILPGSPDYRTLLDQPGMQAKWGGDDMAGIAEINRDFLCCFTPTLTREAILVEIKETFASIRQVNDRVVLDVKGVLPDEERLIQPRRFYCDG